MKEYVEGRIYTLDAGRTNSGTVILKKILGKYFCTVTDLTGKIEWDCMLNRLTEYTPSK